MAATAHIYVIHGSASQNIPGSTDIISTTIYFRLDDTDTVGSDSPIQLPVSGINLSWRKATYIYWSTTPAGAISNLRWFCSGVTAGIGFYARIVSTYVLASGTDTSGITGFTDNQGNRTANDAGGTDGGTGFTSATPLTVNSNSVLSNPKVGASDGQGNGSAVNTGTGTTAGKQDYVEMQAGVMSTFSGGPGGTTWTVTYRYAET
jgi:hypothetical protein